MNTISSSLDWNAVEKNLLEQAKMVTSGQRDLIKICQNIGKMVTKLALEEIECRRKQRSTLAHAELVEEINVQIAEYEKMVTLAILLQN